MPSLSSFGEDACGRVYVMSLAGPVYRIADGGECVLNQQVGARSGDTRPPRLRVRVNHLQRALRTGVLQLRLRCDEQCTMRSRGELQVRRAAPTAGDDERAVARACAPDARRRRARPRADTVPSRRRRAARAYVERGGRRVTARLIVSVRPTRRETQLDGLCSFASVERHNGVSEAGTATLDGMPLRSGSLTATSGDQDEEFCEVVLDGEVRRIRFHDYDEIFEVPGLYEQLFYDELQCTLTRRRHRSARTLEIGVPLEGLRVLDLGAGNGMVGERLAKLGVGPSSSASTSSREAATATDRDRPGVYDDYVVGDMTHLPQDEHRRLEDRNFTCLTSVAALGFGDVPPEAFTAAYDLVQDEGFVAFCIKEDFLREAESEASGFSRLMRDLIERGELEVIGEQRYDHRNSAIGDPLSYVAMVARKQVG